MKDVNSLIIEAPDCPEVSVTEGSSCSARTEESYHTPLNKLQTTQRLKQSRATVQCCLAMKTMLRSSQYLVFSGSRGAESRSVSA